MALRCHGNGLDFSQNMAFNEAYWVCNDEWTRWPEGLNNIPILQFYAVQLQINMKIALFL